MRSVVGVAICVVAVVLGCAEQGGKPEAAKSLAGKKAVFVIAPKGFRDEELQEPLALLTARGCDVTVACSSLDEAVGMLGAKAKPQALLKEVKAADFDAVVFVGGVGASVYFDEPAAHALAKEAAAGGKVLGAICVAPSILARAGVLTGKRATAWKDQKDDLEKHGATWAGGQVERDGRLVTANGPDAAKAFAEALAAALGEPRK